MQAQDLRIGNWVNHDERYFQIHSIADVFPTLNTIEFGIGVVDYNNIFGIELSSDILEKCGFRHRSPDSEKVYSWIHPETNVILNQYKTDNSYFYLYPALWYPTQHLTSLHQLQNVFWCLSGEELKVNL